MKWKKSFRTLYFALMLILVGSVGTTSIPQKSFLSPQSLFIERYQLGHKIGSGGNGVIYEVWDSQENRVVAIKKLLEKQDESSSVSLWVEARLLQRLNHPNIVNVYDFHRYPSPNYYSMEKVDGKNLEETSFEDVGKFLKIAIQAAEALEYLCQEKIVHRDLKPANFIWNDKEEKLTLIDFGLVLIKGKDLSDFDKEVILGTPPYMAPEQVGAGKIDHRTDIYALGATLFHLSTGKHPLYYIDERLDWDESEEEGEGEEDDGDGYQYLTAVLYDKVNSITDLNSSIPIELERIIHKAMEKDPKKRFQTAKEMKKALLKLEKELSKKQKTSPITSFFRKIFNYPAENSIHTSL